MRVGPHGACDDCRTVPCECPPEPPARPSRRVVGSPLSVTFTDEQAAWLQAQRAAGTTLTQIVRNCVQAMMDGAGPACQTKHCHRRKK